MRDRLMCWASTLTLAWTLTASVASAQDRAAPTPATNASSPTASPRKATASSENPAATTPGPAGQAPSQAVSPTESEEVELSAERQAEEASEAEPAPKRVEPAPKKAVATTRSAAADSRSGDREKAATAPPRGRFVLGLRAGWGIPLGEAQSGSDLSATATGEVPIWLDVGYRVLPSLMVGAYGQYAFPFVGQCADGADSCTLHQARFGLQAQYSFVPDNTFDPWVGLGLGYEMLWGTAAGPTASYDAKYSGFEFANLQVGADWSVSQALAAGPFLSFSVGQFSSATFGATSGDIEKKALHQWLLLGVRGHYSL